MSAPNTVLIVSPTASVAGGVQTWLREICTRMDQNRWRPIVALLRGPVAHDADRYRAAYPELETVEIDGRGLDAAGRVRAVRRCLRKVRPEVVMPLTAVDAHHAICAAKADREPARYLLTVPGNVPGQLADAQEFLPFADMLVCPGQLACRVLTESGMPAQRVRHIPNGATYPSTPRVPRRADQPLRLAYVGRLSQGDKRAHDLIGFSQALRALGVPHSLDIVGDGSLDAELRTALQGQARFHGRLDSEQIYQTIYPNLDLLLLFSESEAFGIVLVEAMLHGVVPVTSEFLGWGAEGIVQPEHSALSFPVGDVAAAAQQVARLAQDPELLAKLSSQGRATVTGRYRWNQCAAGWTQALDQILELTPRQAGNPPRPAPTTGRMSMLPAAAADALRRARIAWRGVPSAMLGGEEWPWISKRHTAEHLQRIEARSRALDTAEAGA